jgi:hypothetical protein
MFSAVHLVYCDHNFIVYGHDASNDYQEGLRRLVSDGKVNFAVSTWHWLEMARDKDLSRGLSVAEFTDSLSAHWLFERRGIQRREVEHAFFDFIKIPHKKEAVIGSMAEAIADLVGTDIKTASRYPDSRAFVAHLQTLGDSHPLESNIRKNFEVQRQNAEAYRTGKYTQEMLQRVDRMSIENLLPGKTPAGVVVGREERANFLDSCGIADFPGIAVEDALTKDGWQTNRVLNDRAFRDSQHVIAIPYVDLFVTDDVVLSNAIGRIKSQFAFATAGVITRAEFDRLFM